MARVYLIGQGTGGGTAEDDCDIAETGEQACGGPEYFSAFLEPATDRLRTTSAGLSCLQGQDVARPMKPCVSRNVEKASGKTKVLQEGPEILIPLIAVERKAPEIMEQNGRDDHIKNK